MLSGPRPVVDGGIEAVADGLRRIIARWVKTTTPLLSDAVAGTTTLSLHTTKRFLAGDEIMIRRPPFVGENDGKYEWHENFKVTAVIDDNTLTVNQVIQNNWRTIDGAYLVKVMNGIFLQGIYVGDPDNISHYPAITVNPISQQREWLTIDSVKQTHNIEIGIFVQDSTQEAGERFMWNLASLVSEALMNNIFPLTNDYSRTAFVRDGNGTDTVLYVADATVFCPGNVVLIEDQYKTIEARVLSADTSLNTVTITPGLSTTFRMLDGAILIKVNRFLFNSYPKDVQFGKIHKGTLLKSAIIDWFGWEEIQMPVQPFAWTDTSLS